jgi:hypothetical protein
MGVSVSFKFDAESMARFNRGLEEFARESGWSMEYTALYTAAWLCRDTMWYTPPFVPGSWQGTTKAAYDAGKGALMRDINKIFKPMDARSKRTGPGLLLNRLATAARLGRMSDYFDAQQDAKAITFDSEVVNKIVRDPNPTRGYYKAKNYFAQYSVQDVRKMGAGLEAGELRPIHDSLRRKYKGTLKVYKPMNALGYYLVKSKGILDNYVKERLTRIGNLKAGWWRVMQTLPKPKKRGRSGSVGGIRDIAAYIKRHGGGAGYQTTNFSKENFKVVIGNLIGDMDGVATRTQAAERAILQNDVRLEIELQRVIGEDVRRFNQG